MNLDLIKESIKNKLNRKVIITEKGTRNRKYIYEGVLYRIYPNIFSILTKNGEKSFSYSDVATRDILIKYE